MSAILFNQEQMQEEVSKILSEQGIGSHYMTASSNYQNGEHNQVCGLICEVLLSDKVKALELEKTVPLPQNMQRNCKVSDGGVDIATNVNATMQNVLSSGSYTNISGGNADNTHVRGQILSCNSSFISCSSDLFGFVPPQQQVTRSSNSYECSCNGNHSETSLVTRQMTGVPCRLNSVKKKVAMFEPMAKRDTMIAAAASNSATHQQIRLSGGFKRAVSLPRASQVAVAQVQNREKAATTEPSAMSVMKLNELSASFRAPFMKTSQRGSGRLQKPGMLPTTLNRTQSVSMQRLVQRTPLLSRARTPVTPSDDGRWPTICNSLRAIGSRRRLSVTPDLALLKSRNNMINSIESQKFNTSNLYGTLPRRRKQQSVEDLTIGGRCSRSNSITRETRMTSSVVLPSRKTLAVAGYDRGTGMPTAQQQMKTNATIQPLKPHLVRRPQTKTRIYHETGVQTALNSNDLEKLFNGSLANACTLGSVEQHDQETQSDIDRELERLRDEVRQLTQREHELSAKLQREREEKLLIQNELQLNTQRVMDMLEMACVVGANADTPTSEEGECSGHDSLLMLESQIQISGHELIERQQEIGQLRQLCRSLQMEMEHSLATQECLLQEKTTIEQESNELQDFLQHEKATMCDALKELEMENQSCKQQLMNREEEVKVLRDECRHLVRLNEQRRQENCMTLTKYAALEAKSKELIMLQNAVSGASSALSGLHTRLDSLVEQLVYTYNISEQELEDVPTNICNRVKGENSNENENPATKPIGLELPLQPHCNQTIIKLSSDGSLSPQRNQSFIAAMINAIRNATTHSGKRLLVRNGKASILHVHGGQSKQTSIANEQLALNGDDSDSTEMLDSETEPCLMMDNVLEDAIQPDSHSHNLVSSYTGMVSQIDIPSELVNISTGDDSLQQLSQAITNRQQLELHMKFNMPHNTREQCNTEDLSLRNSLAELPSLMKYSTTQTVVDHVIEVDSIVTKLLKVLRLIQIDNDSCIQQLISDKNKLQQHKENMLEKLKDLEDVNIKLQDELIDATQELMLKSNDLSSTKAEVQQHRNEIGVRF